MGPSSWVRWGGPTNCNRVSLSSLRTEIFAMSYIATVTTQSPHSPQSSLRIGRQVIASAVGRFRTKCLYTLNSFEASSEAEGPEAVVSG